MSMTKRRFAVWGLILALCTGTAGMTTAYAADKTISSVKLQIYTDLEVGDRIGDASIDIDSTTAPGGGIAISGSTDRYQIKEADWTTSSSKEISVGYQPELKIRLEVTDSDYAFKGTYRSSNVTVKGAEFVSASKSSGDLVIKAKLKPIKGTFEAPEDAYWKDNAKGTAKWEEPDNGGTGQYEVELRKGSSKIHTVETTGKTYNFYPYMTQAGTYKFRVRTIAKTSIVIPAWIGSFPTSFSPQRCAWWSMALRCRVCRWARARSRPRKRPVRQLSCWKRRVRAGPLPGVRRKRQTTCVVAWLRR